MRERAVAYVMTLSMLAGCTSNASKGMLPENPTIFVPATHGTYTVSVLQSLGGTNSAANSINNRGWAMGTSFLRGNTTMHAALWRGRKATDLKTLGGPNSAVEWPVENDRGYVSGISETSKNDPLGESKQWSCHAFLPDGGASGKTCLGFVWYGGTMRALPALGGNNGYGAGMNEDGKVAGWAETNVKDSTCVAPQQLQFLPVVWNVTTLKATKLPTLTVNGKTDPDGAATAVNARGDVVGISGICDQAVGRFTARHALLWKDGVPIDLQTIGGVAWNTPVAINDGGQIVGFLDRPGKKDRAGTPNFISAIWTTPHSAPVRIGTLPGDQLSEPTSINDRGVVLGVSFPSSHVYVWQSGRMTDLTKLLLGVAPKLQLVSVGGIDDRGQVAGQACKLVNGACPSSGATLVTVVVTPDRR